jgi:selenoprotein W-related protein
VDTELIWCRKTDGGFPQAAELKRRIRDRVAPGRALGHLDRGE